MKEHQLHLHGGNPATLYEYREDCDICKQNKKLRMTPLDTYIHSVMEKLTDFDRDELFYHLGDIGKSRVKKLEGFIEAHLREVYQLGRNNVISELDEENRKLV